MSEYLQKGFETANMNAYKSELNSVIKCKQPVCSLSPNGLKGLCVYIKPGKKELDRTIVVSNTDFAQNVYTKIYGIPMKQISPNILFISTPDVSKLTLAQQLFLGFIQSPYNEDEVYKLPPVQNSLVQDSLVQDNLVSHR